MRRPSPVGLLAALKAGLLSFGASGIRLSSCLGRVPGFHSLLLREPAARCLRARQFPLVFSTYVHHHPYATAVPFSQFVGIGGRHSCSFFLFHPPPTAHRLFPPRPPPRHSVACQHAAFLARNRPHLHSDRALFLDETGLPAGPHLTQRFVSEWPRRRAIRMKMAGCKLRLGSILMS